ncbi:MAG: hypothetical protein ACYDEP_07945 [Acidimicrobiales bacterium]
MNMQGRRFSTPEIASYLGTTVPRVHRAISKLGIAPERGPKGHLRLGPEDVDRLTAHLGQAPKRVDFSREELFVLSVLWRHPFGLRSGRAAARLAGVQPATALKVLRSLEARAMVERYATTVAEIRPTEVVLWKIRLSPYWITEDIAKAIRATAPPTVTHPRRTDRSVPRRFKHLFWNTDIAHLAIDTHGPSIAASILEQDDTDALAWAVMTLPPHAFRRVANAQRGVTPEIRKLAADIADYQEQWLTS